MYRIDNSTAATTLPTPGAVGPNPNGFFTKGDPASGIPATIVDDDWANAVQEELANAVTSDGTALSKTDRTQLKAKLTGRFLRSTPYYASTTWTKGAGTTKILIRRAVGGGAGGGGSLAPGASACSTCSGGASGSWVEDVWIDVSSITTGTVTIGAAGGASTGTGQNGGATSFVATGISVSCPGGNGGGVKQDPTSTALDFSSQGTPGTAPTITGAISYGVSTRGNPGACGLLFTGTTISGQGGGCPTGGGGTNTNGGNGGQGSGQGAGGGGAAAGAGSADAYGGAGSGGFLEIWEFS